MSDFPLNKNLLIVGAGAHVPYGFPTANDLTELIRSLHAEPGIANVGRDWRLPTRGMSPQLLMKHMLCELAINLKEPISISRQTGEATEVAVGRSLNEFLRSFCSAGVLSIDSYLSQISPSKDEKAITTSIWGRLVITHFIHSAEMMKPFGVQKNDWIQLITDRYMRKNLKEFLADPPKIVTFNYDRYLEKCLYEHLVEFHRIPSTEAFEIVKKLPIIHVYGDLGCFSNWRPQNKQFFFDEAIGNIQVIGEHRSKEAMSKISETIANWVDESSKIYFLGYGFDELNNAVLFKEAGGSQALNNKLVCSTNIGIGRHEANMISNRLGALLAHLWGQPGDTPVDSFFLLKYLAPLNSPTVE